MTQRVLTLTKEALGYTWRELLARIGGNIGKLPVDVVYGDIKCASEPCIVVKSCAIEDWDRLLDRKPNSLHWLPACETIPYGASLPFTDYVPVLLWGDVAQDGCKPFAELWSNEKVVFNADIIATAFFMLSRWEETVIPDRDEHDRFPATASVAYKQGFLDSPIVDEYALVLREWLKVLLPGWEPEQRTFSVKLSHDIDKIYRFGSAYAAVRTFSGDLLKRRSLERALGTARDVLAQVVAPTQTDYVRGIYDLADLSRKCGFSDDAFYFMADGPGQFGCGYSLASPVVRKCIKYLREQGFELGFHPGYDTFQNVAKLAREKTQMDAAIGEVHYGGRQHFLRFQTPETWRHWEQVGLAYDSTMTYADHEGFRCGTCHPFRPFDVERNREIDLWEVPLIVMEGTLRDYREFTPQQGKARILELARRCKQVRGTFTLLWHNSSLDGEWHPWGEMYRRVVRALADLQ